MCRLDDCFEEPVGLFDLVPVEEICLAQLELVQAVRLYDWYTEYICRREKPASSGGPLVRDRRSFDWYFDVEDLGVGLDGRSVGKDICV